MALYYVIDDILAGAPNGFRQRFRNGYPSTVRIHGGRGSVQLPPAWMDAAYRLNAFKPGFQFETPTKFKPNVGWHNTGGDNVVEQLTFSGNLVDVMYTASGRAYISALFVNNPPPPLVYRKYDTAVQMFTVQYKKYLDLSCNSRWAATLIVANPTDELWIDARNLLPYQAVNYTQRITALVANLYTVPHAGTRVVGRKLFGQSVTVSGVVQVGGREWARVGDAWMMI